MKSKRIAFFIAITVTFCSPTDIPAFSSPAFAQAAPDDQANPFEKIMDLGWVKGPATVSITSRAKISIPKGYMYLGEQDTSRFLEMNGNLPQPGRYTIAQRDFRWFAVYAFSADGYVKDNEAIEPAALFKTMKDDETADNEARKAAGLEPMYLDAWVVEPHYEQATRQLEWGTRLHSTDNAPIVNYTSRMLGRAGVMSATLVSDPKNLEKDLIDFRSATGSFSYVPGEKYEEFRNGDKMAEYGLGALIAGGAAAAAAKSGAGKAIAGFGKVIIVGIGAAFLALFGFIKSMFNRKKGS